jgi:hypothetical protein
MISIEEEIKNKNCEILKVTSKGVINPRSILKPNIMTTYFCKNTLNNNSEIWSVISER